LRYSTSHFALVAVFMGAGRDIGFELSASNLQGRCTIRFDYFSDRIELILTRLALKCNPLISASQGTRITDFSPSIQLQYSLLYHTYLITKSFKVYLSCYNFFVLVTTFVYIINVPCGMFSILEQFSSLSNLYFQLICIFVENFLG
jgi:hypothetical protein